MGGARNKAESAQAQLFKETTSAKPARPRVRKPSRSRADNRPVLACEDNLAFMRRIPDGEMKLIVTSPPYNLGKEYEAKSSLDDYIESQKRVIDECVRILHSHGSICWQVGNSVENGEIVPLDSVLYPLFRAR